MPCAIGLCKNSLLSHRRSASQTQQLKAGRGLIMYDPKHSVQPCSCSEHEQSIFILWRKTYIIKRQHLKLPPPCCWCLELAGVSLPPAEQNHSHDPTLHEATKGFWFMFLKQKSPLTHALVSGGQRGGCCQTGGENEGEEKASLYCFATLGKPVNGKKSGLISSYCWSNFYNFHGNLSDCTWK